MDSSDESRKENSEELPRDSDESPSQKSRPSFPHISPSTSSDSDQGTAEVDEDQNASAEVDESHEVRNKKRPYQELQKEYWEDPEKRQNKKAETDFQNDPLIEYGYEHGQTEDDDVGQNEDDEVGQNDNEYSEDDDEVGQNEDDEVGQTDNEYFEDDDEVGHSEDDEVGQTDNEYFDDDDEVGENDNESSEDDEQLFHGEERNSYKRFCREKILCERSDIDNPRSTIENPSSPFTEESDEVTEKFHSLLAELPGEEHDDVYLRLR
jgi:hypothetical protein